MDLMRKGVRHMTPYHKLSAREIAGAIDHINLAQHLLAAVNDLDKVRSLARVKTELEDMRDRLIEGRESA